ncbi:MAG: M1 family peptidase, partial [Bacteroidota bacterium]
LQVRYRWAADVEDFAMPIVIGNGEKEITVTPNTQDWQETILFGSTASDFSIAKERFLVKTKRIQS